MREIKQIGEKILQQKAEKVKDIASKQQLIHDMIRIMRENKGVGIAAPQVGISERIVVIEIDRNLFYWLRPRNLLAIFVSQIKMNFHTVCRLQ